MQSGVVCLLQSGVVCCRTVLFVCCRAVLFVAERCSLSLAGGAVRAMKILGLERDNTTLLSTPDPQGWHYSASFELYPFHEGKDRAVYKGVSGSPSLIHSLCVCVRACVCVCEPACVCVCACVRLSLSLIHTDNEPIFFSFLKLLVTDISTWYGATNCQCVVDETSHKILTLTSSPSPLLVLTNSLVPSSRPD